VAINLNNKDLIVQSFKKGVNKSKSEEFKTRRSLLTIEANAVIENSSP
jgi:hypothetical protein